jgi:hypothetical protein
MMEAARTSETLLNVYRTTRRYNSEDSRIRTHRRENLKSKPIVKFIQVNNFRMHLLFRMAWKDLLPLLFKFAFECGIRKAKGSKEGLELN